MVTVLVNGKIGISSPHLLISSSFTQCVKKSLTVITLSARSFVTLELF